MMNAAQVRVVDPILSTFARGYSNNEFVGRLLFPRVDVGTSGGKVIEFNKSAFQLIDTARAPGAATKRVTLGYEGKDFALASHALEGVVPDELGRDAAAVPGIDLAKEAITQVMDIVALKTEYQQAQMARNATLYPASNKVALTGGDKWGVSTANPKTQVTLAREAIRAATGKYPNVMILPPNSIDSLDQINVIRDRLKYVGADSATNQMLAKYFQVDVVAEANAIFADSENASVFGDVWGNDVILAYVPKTILGARQPSYGYTYSMRGQPSVKVPYYESNRESWIYGCKFEHAPVIAGVTAGFLIQNAF